MKKLLSIICTVAMLISLLTIPGLAVESPAGADKNIKSASVETQEIKPDDTDTPAEETTTRAVTALPTTASSALAVTSSAGKPYLNSTYRLDANTKGDLKVTASMNMSVSVFTTGNVNTYLKVYKTSSLATLVTSDDDSAHGLNAYVNFYIPSGSTYYIQVSGATTSASGNYGLILHRGAATSGSEKPTMFTTFNSSSYKKYNNCYTYALGYYVDPVSGNKWRVRGQNPGEMAGSSITLNDLRSASAATTAIEAACKADAKIYGGTFRSIEKDEQPAAGYYKVALVLDPGNDYHWYRQIGDGYWTHKPGTTSAIDSDDNGYLIYYPDAAARGDYTEFLGYYEVKAPEGQATYGLTPNNDFDPLLTYPVYTDLTIEDINSLEHGMSEDDVMAILGQPHDYTGSGMVGCVYQIGSGEIVIYYANGEIDQIRAINSDGTYQILVD